MNSAHAPLCGKAGGHHKPRISNFAGKPRLPFR